MAHFAKIEDGVVRQVVVINNEVITDEKGKEQESLGAEFCQSLLGGTWIQTSYNGNIRKNYAGIGYTYDSTRDAFIPIKPECHPSEISLNEQTCQWKCDDPSHKLP